MVYICVLLLGNLFLFGKATPPPVEVNHCPPTEEQWKDRERKFNCPLALPYQCLKTVLNRLYELCISPQNSRGTYSDLSYILLA